MKKEKRKKSVNLRLILAVAFTIAGFAGAIYVGVYLMCIKPIMAACAAFDAGCLTATLVGVTVLKCVFAGAVGMLIMRLGYVAALCLLDE